MAIGENPTQPYGLRYPTVSEIREALARVHGGDIDRLWAELLAAAEVTASTPDQDGVDRLVEVMDAAGGLTRLTGHAMRIRTRSYHHLMAAHEIIRSAR